MSYPQDNETANDYQDYVIKYSKSFDVYVALIAHTFNIRLDDVLQANVKK